MGVLGWAAYFGHTIDKSLLLSHGAKTHSSVSLESFVREFDLVEIKECISIFKHPTKSRKSVEWRDNKGPSLRLRSISIGQDCVVKGMLSPQVLQLEGECLLRSSQWFCHQDTEAIGSILLWGL